MRTFATESRQARHEAVDAVLSLLVEAMQTGHSPKTVSAYLTLKAALVAAAAGKQPVPAPNVPPPYKLPLRQERVEKFGGNYWRVVDSDGREVDDATVRALAVTASHHLQEPSKEAVQKLKAVWHRPGGLMDGPFA